MLRCILQMDSRQPWNDFHFLNTAFREVIQLGSQEWISTSLVRFSYRGNKDHKISMTMKAIDGLAIEYAVPFPLTYLFGPESSVSYSSLFCFLLQIRRGKSVLDSILIRGLNGRVLDINGLKAFHALRGKLSWFVKCVVALGVSQMFLTNVKGVCSTFMSFIMTNVCLIHCFKNLICYIVSRSFTLASWNFTKCFGMPFHWTK